MVQGTMTCIKYLMFVFNFLFVVCGLVLVIVGAVVTKKDVTQFMDNKYVTAPVILMVVGCVIFFVAFLGCCGAVKENHCMVMTFGLLVLVIFIVELAGGISAYIYQGEVKNFLHQNMETSLAQNKSDAVKVWNEMQHRLECCGVDGPGDYGKYKLSTPSSCCVDQDKACTSPFKDGCYDKAFSEIKGYIGTVGGVAIGLGVVELLGCVFAWCLAAAIKRDYEGV